MSAQIKNGGTAFPMQDQQAINAYASAQIAYIADAAERDKRYMAARAEAISGATMRDYFAAKAMQGELAAMVDPSGSQCGIALDAPDEALARIAKHFYRIADAMLKAREGDCHE